MSQRIGNFSAVSSMIVATLGSGITLMPAFYNALGNTNASLVMAVIGLISFIACYSIAYAAKVTEFKNSDSTAPEDSGNASHSTFSYESIASSFSSLLSLAVALTLLVSALTTAFSFVQTLQTLVFQTLKFNSSMFDMLSPTDTKEMPTLYYAIKIGTAALLALVYFPLFQKDSLASLSFFSTLSLGCAILFSVVMFCYGLFAPFNENALQAIIDDIKALPSNSNLPVMPISGALGAVIFALHNQFSIPDILSAMQNQSLSNFRNVIMLATFLATLLYSAVGMLGFRAFGPALCSDTVILSFGNPQSPLSLYLKEACGDVFGVIVPRAIQTAYIPIFFSGILFCSFGVVPILQKIFGFRGKPASRTFVATILSIFVLVSGIVKFEDLSLLFGIIGFLFVTPLSFLFPGMFVFLASKRFNMFKLISVLMIGLSLVIMIGLAYDTFKGQF